MPTILYAEDDKDHRFMMQLYLKNTGIELIEASNGEEALQIIEQQRPDLILLDLFMPGVDGYTLMDSLRANPETKDIPIIVLSAWPKNKLRRAPEEAGAVDFILKPYDPFFLVRIIEKRLAKS